MSVHSHRRLRRGVTGIRLGLAAFVADETGATAIEYGLIVALIAIAIITAVTAVGTNLKTKFSSVGSTIGSA
jgi:pilus assembly protein Flp/PilA